MRRIDYDTEQYQDYARGRALTPLAGLDVGSGTGRFTPALARAFGPVTGVEPAVRMREIAQAQAQSRHPSVRYLAGSAEDMPVPSGSADYVLMFLSWHHVQDKPRAARELARVLRPAGRLLLRANFSDHHPDPWWLEHFPRGSEVDASLFQPLHEVIALFTSAGWRVASFGTVTLPSSGTRGDALERLRLCFLSRCSRLNGASNAGGASLTCVATNHPALATRARRNPLRARRPRRTSMRPQPDTRRDGYQASPARHHDTGR
jgi:SAM-dependent methyltransferase